ncbi:hypothetical protein RF11_07596 [Thelohanellus kitauei]|uniref:Uncharacterized protein n=1 Tax=Thelohanellus kitauei TaxID=669202 RepID=A0A0C2N2G4_THEKT|nr:hypothetical protein RF11_07596 [Thelohanellus kitauei]
MKTKLLLLMMLFVQDAYKFPIDKFEIIQGYRSVNGRKNCSDDNINNFDVCPIRAYLNIDNNNPILLYDYNSNNTEKKLYYSIPLTRKAVFAAERKYADIYSFPIYFVAGLYSGLNGVDTNYDAFEIISSDFHFGMFSKRCENCLGINRIVQYSGLIK